MSLSCYGNCSICNFADNCFVKKIREKQEDVIETNTTNGQTIFIKRLKCGSI